MGVYFPISCRPATSELHEMVWLLPDYGRPERRQTVPLGPTCAGRIVLLVFRYAVAGSRSSLGVLSPHDHLDFVKLAVTPRARSVIAEQVLVT